MHASTLLIGFFKFFATQLMDVAGPLKARDQHDATDQQERAQTAHQVEGVWLNAQQAEVVNGDRHDERGGDIERGVSARADVADELQPGIHGHRAN